MDTAIRKSSSSRVPTIIGIVAALVWLHYLPSLWPHPPRSELPIDVQWSFWWEGFLLTLLGLAAAALALRALRFWQVALLATSGFMVLSTIPSIVADLVHAPSFHAWFGLFQHVSAASVYYLLVLPLYHLAIVAAVLVYVAFTLRARAHGQGHAA